MAGRQPRPFLALNASIVPPPFGSGYNHGLWTGGDGLPGSTLQLCRPLSGAVISRSTMSPDSSVALQLCRPLSGAVIWPACCAGLPYTTLQLCRPLSGAVITWRMKSSSTSTWLQLCRPLSGAVIRGSIVASLRRQALQLCRPLSGAVIGLPRAPTAADQTASIVPPPFGSGYLACLLRRLAVHYASIVPPPFGSGYGADAAHWGGS